MVRRLLVSAALAASLRAHAPQPVEREFETASIKPYKPQGSHAELCNSHSDPVTLGLTRCTLRQLVVQAYSLKDYQLAPRGPAWMETDPYAIQARTAQPTTRPEKMRMLQNLLAARFQLKLRWETHDGPVYQLKLAANGPKLAPATETTHCGEVFFRPGIAKADCVSMDDIVETLESIVTDHPVVNETGMAKEGRYKLNLEYSSTEDPKDGASIFTAISEQLGLTLKTGKAPLRMVTIEHAQRPTPN